MGEGRKSKNGPESAEARHHGNEYKWFIMANRAGKQRGWVWKKGDEGKLGDNGQLEL